MSIFCYFHDQSFALNSPKSDSDIGKFLYYTRGSGKNPERNFVTAALWLVQLLGLEVPEFTGAYSLYRRSWA